MAYWVLLILAIIYVPIYIWVRRSPNAEKYGLVKYGPLIMIKTKFGTRLMERWSKYRRFWRFFGALSIAISLVLMAFIILIIIVGISNLSMSFSSPGIGIEYALAIPGLNPLLPLGYGILGLVVAMVIHELAHGFQTRANDMRVDSTGLLYGVVPIGAFVEPNEEDIEKSTRRVKLDLYSAGVSTNFIAAVITFFIFAVVMMGNISSSYGDNAAAYQLTADSPAYDAGIPSGAIIQFVDGEEYLYSDDYTLTYSWNPGDMVTVTYLTQDGQNEVDVRWGLFIERITSNSPAYEVLQEKTFLLSIDYKGENFPLYGYSEFLSFMQTTEPNTPATITYMTADGTTTDTVDITFGDNGGIGYIGIVTSTSGMNFTTPNIMLDKGRNPIAGADTVSEAVTSMLAYIAGPFQGFSPVPQSVQWWYDVPFEGGFWIIISALFWIFWLNIMLGVSNAIPAYPFDGGFIFQGSLSALLQKLGMKDDQRREDLTSRITSSLSMIMIFLLILVIVAVVL